MVACSGDDVVDAMIYCGAAGPQPHAMCGLAAGHERRHKAMLPNGRCIEWADRVAGAVTDEQVEVIAWWLFEAFPNEGVYPPWDQHGRQRARRDAMSLLSAAEVQVAPDVRQLTDLIGAFHDRHCRAHHGEDCTCGLVDELAQREASDVF